MGLLLFQIGNSQCLKYVLLFLAPGKMKCFHTKFAMVKRGKFRYLVGYLGKTNRNLLKIPNRYKNEIINSTNIVHFKTLDGRSEGDKKEIDLKNIEYVRKSTIVKNLNT